MRDKLLLLVLLSACLLLLVPAPTAQTTGSSSESKRREVAITFDDLPIQQSYDVETLRALTGKLLASITSNKIPAIGFVNESKLYQQGELEARTAILKMWVDAGLELGNHTYSHLRLYDTPLDKFQADVIRGEAVTKKLLGERRMKLRYFRHPTLNTGPNLATKRAFEKFLAARGYTIAPVTIDNSEWIFARAYAEAKKQSDRRLMRRVAASCIMYLEEVFQFYEKLSQDVVGYEVKQTLLLHANALNADYFDEVVQMLKRRGYSFISLEQALADKAYRLPDNYVGPVGISWLQRWAMTKGMEFRQEPGLPEFMKQFDTPASGSGFKTRKSE